MSFLNPGMAIRLRKPPSVAAAYTGPGDIVSGAKAWYGLRAYNAAYATGSNPAIDVFKSDGSVGPTTINILANGSLDVATISGLGYAVVVSKIYDHTGNGNHLTQSTNANRPALTLSGLGSLPIMSFTRTSNQRLDLAGNAFNAGSTIAQPWTISAVAKTVSLGSGAYGTIFNGDNGSIFTALYFQNNGGNQNIDFFINADDRINKAAATWYAIQGVANGASSDLNIDGTANAFSGGASAFQSNNVEMGNDSSTGDAMDGSIFEVGLWPSAFSGANSTSMSSNQHSYCGF